MIFRNHTEFNLLIYHRKNRIASTYYEFYILLSRFCMRQFLFISRIYLKISGLLSLHFFQIKQNAP